MTGTKPIQVVLFDIDGVLTDGGVYVSPDGRELKKIRYDDIDAYFLLRREGFVLGFITGEKGPFDRYFRRRFSPDAFLSGCKDKLEGFKKLAMRNGWKKEQVCYVGDAALDAPLLRHVRYGLAPRDADPAARRGARSVLPVGRGEGVVRQTHRWIERLHKRGFIK